MKRFVGFFVFLWVGFGSVWGVYEPTESDENLMEKIDAMIDKLSVSHASGIAETLKVHRGKFDSSTKKSWFFYNINISLWKKWAEYKSKEDESLPVLDQKTFDLLMNHIDPAVADYEIVILEFTDLECPFCARHHTAGTLQTVVDAYPEVSYATLAFPLSFHPLARPAAEAMLCAQTYASYDAATELKDELLTNGLDSVDDIQSALTTLWLTSTSLTRCISTNEMTPTVDQQMALWKSMWAQWTPANILFHMPTKKYFLISGAVSAERFDEPVRAMLEWDWSYFDVESPPSVAPGWWWAPTPEPVTQADSLDRAEFLTTAHILWNPEASVSVIEFSDVQCPFCRRHTLAGTLDQVLQKYGDDINIIFGHFPLSFHPNAQQAGEAIECAGKIWWEQWFFDFKAAYYQAGGDASLSIAKTAAESVGLDGDELIDCVESGEFTQLVQDSMAFGQSLWVTGTPGHIILDTQTLETTKISGAVPAESFDEAIKRILNK